MNIPQNLLYTRDHEWIQVEGDQGRIGISDFAQHHLGDIVYIELPEIGAEPAQGAAIGVIESVKGVATLFCPAGGTIIEVNQDLEESPELLNQDPYKNWIAVVELGNMDDLNNLMNPHVYAEHCKHEEESEG
jgi:glycine cleavage system H protein